MEGVSSMSLDPHKYGYSLKGSSVVLYAHGELRRSQYFCYPEWTGGIYTTPTVPIYLLTILYLLPSLYLLYLVIVLFSIYCFCVYLLFRLLVVAVEESLLNVGHLWFPWD